MFTLIELPYAMEVLGDREGTDTFSCLKEGLALTLRVKVDNVTGGQVPRHVTWFMYPKYAELGRALNQSVAEVA